MTKSDLEQIKGLKSEIKVIQEDLQNLPMTKDSVTGSMVDYPYIKRTMVITGLDEDKGHRLRRKLERKLGELQDTLFEMEDWLDSVRDAEMRTILRLKCRNGMTNKQIASELGYDKSTITKKINKILEEK
ncbi:hypothetical protein [Anaerovorax sp. IOR16]|uniref:hypothetical protein n=1 Tax=Anaerovorax sp. IOR16 TaxID=2773458 RepID=UPI0019CFB59A|nr:hypothetical protein [Anaerovorax sp. IOR16]